MPYFCATCALASPALTSPIISLIASSVIDLGRPMCLPLADGHAFPASLVNQGTLKLRHSTHHLQHECLDGIVAALEDQVLFVEVDADAFVVQFLNDAFKITAITCQSIYGMDATYRPSSGASYTPSAWACWSPPRRLSP